MVNARCIDLSRIPPPTQEGLYATNYQFQRAGPKGFIQVKVLENDNLYVRVDLPGVPDDAVRYRVDGVIQKIVFFSGETLEHVNEKDGVRKYSGIAGLGCNCCKITDVDAKMKDGVLRMIVSRVKVNKDQQNNKRTFILPPFTGQSGRHVEDHPYVVKGRKGALFGASTAGGGLYFTVDLPGVSKDDVQVFTWENEIRYYAENKNVYEHDESGRIYEGSIVSPSYTTLPSVSSHTITWDAEFGVLKIHAIPPGNTNNN